MVPDIVQKSLMLVEDKWSNRKVCCSAAKNIRGAAPRVPVTEQTRYSAHLRIPCAPSDEPAVKIRTSPLLITNKDFLKFCHLFYTSNFLSKSALERGGAQCGVRKKSCVM